MQPGLVAELGLHAISLEVCEEALALMPSKAFDGICQLTRLTSLRLDQLGVKEGQQISLQAISQLSALQHLDLTSSWAGRQLLQAPFELSRLQALECLHLSGFSSSTSTFGALPRLTELTLKLRAPVSSHPPEALNIPSDLSCLPRLVLMHLCGAMLSSSLLGLSNLHDLTCFRMSHCILVPGFSAAQFSLGLGHLTSLQSLHINVSPERIDTEALSRLAALTRLSIVSAGLPHMHCSSAWRNLKCLQLYGNRLVCMPENLSCLSSLVQLGLEDQQSVHFQVTQPLLPIVRALPFLQCIKIRQSALQDSGQGQHQWNGVSTMYIVEAAETLHGALGRFEFVF